MDVAIILLLLAVLVNICLRAFVRHRAFNDPQQNEVSQSAAEPGPPEVIPGTARLHPNGSVYHYLTDGQYGGKSPEGTIYYVSASVYFAGKPLYDKLSD